MKYLKLKFVSARLIKEKSLKNMLGSNKFYHPINKYHVYNSVAVLFGRTPKPQLRDTKDIYLPFFEDIMEIVENGFIKINLTFENENITTIKKSWNSNLTESKQYTWLDCEYCAGTLLPKVKEKFCTILKINDLGNITFDNTILLIQKLGSIKPDGSILYSDPEICNLIDWLKTNTCSPIANYIENKQLSSRSTQFGKRVNRGIVNSNNYSGEIIIPITDILINELLKYSKGFSKILDGGVVKIVSLGEMFEDDFDGFTEINKLNNTKKFEIDTNGVVWDNTIFRELKSNDLIKSVDSIIEKSGLEIDRESNGYIELIKKIDKIGYKKEKIGEIGYKINHFIEREIDKQYK